MGEDRTGIGCAGPCPAGPGLPGDILLGADCILLGCVCFVRLSLPLFLIPFCTGDRRVS